MPNADEIVSVRVGRAEARTEACRLSVLGWSYDRIWRERPDLGFNNRMAVHRACKAALAEAVKRQNLAADELRQKELMLIEEALAKASEIMGKVHLAHSNGRLVRREVQAEDGTVTYVEIEDSGPQLAAADRLVRFSESRRKLLGLDAPTKTEAQVESTISYVIKATPEELELL